MNRALTRAALFAAATLPVAALSFAADPGGMQNITPYNFQSFNSNADTYLVRDGVVVSHTPAYQPAPGTGHVITATPAGMQSFATYEDMYTMHGGVASVTPAAMLPPAAPMRVTPYASESAPVEAESMPIHTAGAWKYVTSPTRVWVPTQGVSEPLAEDGPDSLKGE